MVVSQHRLVRSAVAGIALLVASSAAAGTPDTQPHEISAAAAAPTSTPVAAIKWKRCGKIRANASGNFVVRKKGKVTCRGARKLMHLFLNEGQGVKHGGPSSAETYYTLYGWRCGTGAGGGGCTRAGGRDRTQAHWVA